MRSSILTIFVLVLLTIANCRKVITTGSASISKNGRLNAGANTFTAKRRMKASNSDDVKKNGKPLKQAPQIFHARRMLEIPSAGTSTNKRQKGLMGGKGGSHKARRMRAIVDGPKATTIKPRSASFTYRRLLEAPVVDKCGGDFWCQLIRKYILENPDQFQGVFTL